MICILSPVNPEFHWMCVHSRTALLHVSFEPRRPSTPTACVQVVFQSAVQPDSWSHKTTSFHSNFRIECDRGLWNLWSVDFRPSSAHNDGLFMKFGEIWSGVNTECFILKLTLFSDTTDQDTCFHVVSVSDFLSCLTCSALNCCVVFHLHHHWQKHKPCVSAADGSGSPEQRRGGNTTQPQPLEAHTLTRIEMYQLHCCSGAETQHTCIQWNLGASLHSVD